MNQIPRSSTRRPDRSMRDDEPTGVSSSGTTEAQEKTVPLRLYAELERKYEELTDRVERVELSRDAAHRRIDELEDQIEDEKGGVRADETTTRDDDLLPIERLMRLRNEDGDHPALPSNGRESFDRATKIFENFGQWSKRTPKGRTVTDGLKKLLETATGERLAWRQVYRAMDKVEEWTNGVITHETTSRHGHVLVMDERASSVRRGG
jgi:hypothetical protein